MNILNVLIFIQIYVPLTWTIYVPEYTKTSIKLNGGDDASQTPAINKEKLQQSVNNYHLKTNNDEHNDNDQQKLFTKHHAKMIAHEKSPILRQQKSYDFDDDVVISAKNHTANVHENLEAQPTGLTEQRQHNADNNDVLRETLGENEFENNLQLSRHRRQLSDFLIAPNTRWCGRGNTANGTYNHLGGATMADKCCRTHDHCKAFIPAMSNRFDLFNYRPYTLSHCNCDRRFRTCLKMANDEDANTIGKLFFNLVQTQCFVLTKEVTCQQRATDGICLKEHIKQKAYLRHNKKY